MTACDVADCPREGTNELPVKVFDPETRSLVPANVHLCDPDFHAVHDAAARFSIGQDVEER